MKRTIQLISILAMLFSCEQKKKENSTIVESSNNYITQNKENFFNFSIPDTISLGKHIGRVTEYNKPKETDKDYLLSVIVSNQYEDSKIKKDTFSNVTLKPFFGINGFKTGKQEVKLMIEEQILETVLKDKDSYVRIMKINHEYEFIVTVVEGNYISKLEKNLLAEMKEKTKK